MKYSPLRKRILQLNWLIRNTRPNENLKESYEEPKCLTPPNLLAFLGSAFGLVVAEEELPVEELDADHGEDEQEEDVDDEDVEDILEGDHDAVKDSLEGGHPVDHLERTQHTQKLHRLQLSSSGRSPESSYYSNSLSGNFVNFIFGVNVKNHFIKKEAHFCHQTKIPKFLGFSQKFVDFWGEAVTWTWVVS